VISIINYGIGNVAAFSSAYEKLGILSEEIKDPSDLLNSSHIILPGVGSFEIAIDKLNSSGFVEPLNRLVTEQRVNILGVCVGFQMMGKNSEEMSTREGLGWINARTIKIEKEDKRTKLKLPHMGWNRIIKNVDCPLLNGIEDEEFYFLHSYNVKLDNEEEASSTCSYGQEFASSVSIGNIFGTQFHPEKSHNQGLKLLENFARI
jgi:glutamine amidotransferase